MHRGIKRPKYTAKPPKSATLGLEGLCISMLKRLLEWHFLISSLVERKVTIKLSRDNAKSIIGLDF